MQQSRLSQFFGAPARAAQQAHPQHQEQHQDRSATSSKRAMESTEDSQAADVDALTAPPPSKRPKLTESASESTPGTLTTVSVAATPGVSRREALARRLMNCMTEASWRTALASEFEQPYWKELASFLDAERTQFGPGEILPPEPLIFTALNTTPLSQVRVVILGQDPYHGPGQAHGLSFSVQKGVPVPPSLRNIFQELSADLGAAWSPPSPAHGCLVRWAGQGVLLLNAVLTVRKGAANSHQGKGWEHFTDAAIKAISATQRGVVFILWGGYAQKKAVLIQRSKHHILTSAHPSPLSVTKFRGCKHFSKANELLQQQGLAPIDWRLDGPLPTAQPAPSSSSEATSPTEERPPATPVKAPSPSE